MQEVISRYSFPIFFFLWLVLFFPGWYGLSYTKVRELQATILQEREQQLVVLHPAGEMEQLVQLNEVLKSQYSGKSVAVLPPIPNTKYPLATDVTMLRAVLYPIPVVSWQEIAPDVQVLAFVVTELAEGQRKEQKDDQKDNREDDEEVQQALCQEQVPESYTGEVVCWPILPR